MKTILVTEDLVLLAVLLDRAGEEALLLQTQDGREFISAQIDEFGREVELTRQNPEVMALLDERGRSRDTNVLQDRLKLEMGIG